MYNSIAWYPFPEGATVLEIYQGEAVLKKLPQNIKVTSIEMATWEKEQLSETFDYITFLGSYEIAPLVELTQNPYTTLLQKARHQLKEGGTILLAVDNRFGIKYFVGGKSAYEDQIFQGLESGIQMGKGNLLSKQEIKKAICEAGFLHEKFYYPVPDYRHTNTIYTDDFLPKADHSKIVYPTLYEQGSVVLYNEIDVMKQICKKNLFPEFTNSYLVELSDREIQTKIRFVHYNQTRKDPYCLTVVMKENQVEKYPRKPEAVEHIQHIKSYIDQLKELGFQMFDRVEGSKVISPFISEPELDKIIIRLLRQRKIKEALEEINRWYQFITEKLLNPEKNVIEGKNIFETYQIEVPEDILSSMKITKFGYLDLSFENIFCKEKDYVFYDQEWYFENIPIEYLLFRAIHNLYVYNKPEIQPIISKEEMFATFGIQSFIPYFEQIEKKIQHEIIDPEKIQPYQNQIGTCFTHIESLQQEIEEQNVKNQNLERQLEQLKQEKEKVEKEYQLLVNDLNHSRGWKMIKGFRKMLGKG